MLRNLLDKFLDALANRKKYSGIRVWENYAAATVHAPVA